MLYGMAGKQWGHVCGAGSRQASKLRQRYLQAVLRQEPAYFDVHATTGELLQGLNDDTTAIQMAIGEKVHTLQCCHAGHIKWLQLLVAACVD